MTEAGPAFHLHSKTIEQGASNLVSYRSSIIMLLVMQFPNQKLLWYANNALFQKNLKMNRNSMKTVAKGKMKENQILKLY